MLRSTFHVRIRSRRHMPLLAGRKAAKTRTADGLITTHPHHHHHHHHHRAANFQSVNGYNNDPVHTPSLPTPGPTHFITPHSLLFFSSTHYSYHRLADLLPGGALERVAGSPQTHSREVRCRHLPRSCFCMKNMHYESALRQVIIKSWQVCGGMSVGRPVV